MEPYIMNGAEEPERVLVSPRMVPPCDRRYRAKRVLPPSLQSFMPVLATTAYTVLAEEKR
jgi:hypothetical protein